MKTYICHLRLDAGPGYDSSDFRDVVASLSTSYIITEELAKATKKVHWHCHCYVNSDSKHKSVLVNFRRKIKSIHQSIKGSKFYVKRCKHEMKSLVYVLKDGNIIYSSHMPKEQLAEAKQLTEKINKEKNLNFKQKLVLYVQENYDLPTIQQIQRAVLLYHNEHDILSPVFSLLKRYADYISYKIIHPISPEQHIENQNKLFNIQ